MRKIIVSEMMTVDGFFCGPNGEIDWHRVDAEFNEYAIQMLNAADTIFFGRVTYEMMAAYWPAAPAVTDDPIVAERMNNLKKIVFSKTKQEVLWNNSELAGSIVREDIMNMKEQPGKDMLVLGSGTIVSAFTELELIDEYRLIVNPVALGKGRTLFEGLAKRAGFSLVSTRKFNSGNVLLCYGPSKK